MKTNFLKAEIKLEILVNCPVLLFFFSHQFVDKAGEDVQKLTINTVLEVVLLW